MSRWSMVARMYNAQFQSLNIYILQKYTIYLQQVLLQR